MRTAPISIVDAETFGDDVREKVGDVADRARHSGTVDLDSLPEAARAQLHFALDAYARGETVFAVADTKPLTSNEAAKVLGVSRTHLTRLCAEGAIESFTVGNALRVPAAEVRRILSRRAQVTAEAHEAAATSEQRRVARAARAAGLA